MNETQPNSNRALMAEITPQTQGFDGNDVLQSGLDKIGRRRAGRPIVDQQHLSAHWLRAQCGIQSRDKLTRAFPVAIDRQENGQAKGFCCRTFDASSYNPDRLRVTSTPSAKTAQIRHVDRFAQRFLFPVLPFFGKYR